MYIKDKTTNKLITSLIKGLEEKKANNIVLIDMIELGSSISDYFIICHGTSNTQVESLADSAEQMAKELCKERPFTKEGKQNAEWILLDYSNVIVHVFQEEAREFYNIEGLWADGKFTYIDQLKK